MMRLRRVRTAAVRNDASTWSTVPSPIRSPSHLVVAVTADSDTRHFRHFHHRVIGRNEGVAVGQALAGNGVAVYFVLPLDVALQIALADSQCIVLGNEDAIRYLHRRLERIGIIEKLRKMGAEDGDTVRVGKTEFAFSEDL